MSDRAAEEPSGGPCRWRTTGSCGRQSHGVIVVCTRGVPEPRFSIFESPFLLKAKTRFFCCRLGWRDCMSLGRLSGGSVIEPCAKAVRCRGRFLADPPVRRWAWTSCNRIIATLPSVAWNRDTGWGDRTGLSPIVREKKTLPGSVERKIRISRRPLFVLSPGRERFPQGHRLKGMSAIRVFRCKFAMVLADSRKS